MAESLRDQLLKSGLARQLKPSTPPVAPTPVPKRDGPRRDTSQRNAPQRDARSKPTTDGGKGRSREEIDLAKAYALRNQAEARDRQRAQQEQEQRAREKKERRQKLAEAVAGQSLNAADADVARHFPHADKIRRVYVTAEQLPLLNRGELGVVQHAGRFLLVTQAVVLAVQAIDPDAVLLLVDPDQPAEDDVPADLIW